MFKHIELFAPDFVFKCNTMKISNEVYEVMRNNGIRRSHCYAIITDDPNQLLSYTWLKIGRSSPNPGARKDVQVGERIARQLFHLRGWEYLSGHNPISSNGQDFMNGLDSLEEHGILTNFDKDKVIVAVWDVSKRMCFSDIVETDDSELYATGWLEGELCAQYKQRNNETLPLLNFVDPTKAKYYIKGYVSKDVAALFSGMNFTLSKPKKNTPKVRSINCSQFFDFES
jgi:hypothetical protein